MAVSLTTFNSTPVDLFMIVIVLQLTCAMFCLCKSAARRPIIICCAYVTHLLITPFLSLITAVILTVWPSVADGSFYELSIYIYIIHVYTELN